MAVMIPFSLKNIPATTAGERKLFDLFRKTLPDSCEVRYEVLLSEQERRPDYTLIDPKRGVMIIEVKDWGVDSITQATEQQFRVRGMGGSRMPIAKMNPGLKCQIYMRDAREQLLAMPVLRNEADRLVIPTEYFVAFPNIRRREFSTRGLDKVVDSDHVLFKEDLTASGKLFLQRYTQALPELEMPLIDKQIDAVKAALLPDLAIPPITEPGVVGTEDKGVVRNGPIETYNLSLEQEQIAKSLGEGPRLLRGIAGTGKTLIMLYRAKMLAANDKDVKILILCWNISLANYMRQAYGSLQFEAQGQIDIQHFAEFARDLFKRRRIQHDKHEHDDPRFSKQLEGLTIKEFERYDAIYVDEAQDFRQEWIAFLYHRFLRGEPKERNLLVAADDAQRIYYQRDFRWADLGIPMVGRSKILKKVYRNSARVWIFSAFLLQDKASYVREDSERVQFSSKGGYDPQLIECESLERQIEKAIEIIQAMLQSGFAARNVLILYKGRSVKGFPLVEHLMDRLGQENILHDWIAEDARAKRFFDWNADTVKISTVHSAKGMDSPVVIVLGAETFQPETMDQDDYDCDDTRLMYVALTRAREFLVVLHTGNDGIVPQLQYCHEEYLKYRPAIETLEDGSIG